MANALRKQQKNNTGSNPVKIQDIFEEDEEGGLTIGSEALPQLYAALGTNSVKSTLALLHQVIPVGCGSPQGDKLSDKVNALISLLSAINPSDELEGMLAVQMVGIHSMSMEMMKRAMRPDQTVDGVNNNINRATKLTRTFIAQMDALNKHRGKGQQKMTVEHVHVNEGGQAVIGNVERGGDESKK